MNIKKKFIIISNTEDDTFMNEMYQQANEPNVLYMKTSKYGKRSIAGDLLDSADAKSDLCNFIE